MPNFPKSPWSLGHFCRNFSKKKCTSLFRTFFVSNKYSLVVPLFVSSERKFKMYNYNNGAMNVAIFHNRARGSVAMKIELRLETIVVPLFFHPCSLSSCAMTF